MSLPHCRRAAWRSAAAFVCALIAACARDEVRGVTDTAESAAAVHDGSLASEPSVSAGTGAALDTVRTPAAGTWSIGLAENKLRSNRLAAVRQPQEVRRPGLAVSGTRYQVDGATLEIFVYGDVMARGRDTDALDVQRVAQGGGAPTLITDGNLAALLYAATPALTERVRTALRTEADDGPLRPASGNPDRPTGARR